MAYKTRQAAYLKKKELPAFSYKWVNWFVPVVLLSLVLIWTQDNLNDPKTLPVNKIQVHGIFANIDEAMLHRAIDGVVSGGYFNVNVEQVREVVEQLPWVDKASVRRVWPDGLSINVVEQQPVAVSEKSGLINSEGEVFKPVDNYYSSSLPVFEGSESLNKLMLNKYYEMNKVFALINQKIIYLKFDDRHAIELKLDNGLKIVLGRDDTIKRLERLIRIYKKVLAVRINEIEKIDLRYTNGMAIGWKKMNKNIKDVSGDMKHV